MVSVQQKFQKKKDREKEVRKKILARRESERLKAKEQEKLDRASNAHEVKRKPICSVAERRQKSERDEEIRKQLQHNIQILKNLEEQYDQEVGKIVDPNTITLCQSPEELNIQEQILKNNS